MVKQDNKTRLFQRYNRIVLIVFALVVLLAVIIFTSRSYSSLTEHQARHYQKLTSDVELFDQRLQLGVNTINNLADLAQYHLKHPNISLSPTPRLVDDEDGYYLDLSYLQDKRLISNLTGKGSVKQLSESKLHEIKMTQQISPAFTSAMNMMPEASWLYYLSNREFISIFPWIDKEQWRYNSMLLTATHYRSLLQLTEDTFYWSSPYFDAAGTGASVSLGKGVYQQSEFIGALVLDINLPKFAQHLTTPNTPQTSIVVFNQQQEVLIALQKKQPVERLLQWQEVTPQALSTLSLDDIKKQGKHFNFNGWWVEVVALSANGWSVIQFQPYQQFISPVIYSNLLDFILSVGALSIVVLVVYLLTLRSFIKPTKSFIQHIENTAKGDPGKELPPLGWQYWYQLVENIFGQNRSLMQQLKDQNSELDQRVDIQTQALREKSEQHERDFAQLVSVVNAIPELIIFTDAQGLIIGVNRAFKKFINVQNEEFLGNEVSSLLPDPIAHVLNHFTHITQQGNTKPLNISNVEVNEQHFNIYCGYIFSDDKEILGSVIIIRDVTAQFATEIALMSAKEHAEEANKAKSQFLANMSHEIRTPINAIDGMMSILESTSLSQLQNQYIDTAQSASSSLLRLVDELLDLAKVESGKMQLFYRSCSLDNIIEQAIQFNLKKAKQKGLDFIVELSPELPAQIKTDEGRLVQVLNNILNNAVKFTHKGSIQLKVSSVKQQKNQLSTQITFAIKDTGIGIKSEAQVNLFNAFTQVDESMTREYGGSGLGLAICQQIVSLMGGKININSSPENGSEFSFTLSFEEVEYHQLLQNQIAIAFLDAAISRNAIEGIMHLGANVNQYTQAHALITLSENTVLVLHPDIDNAQSLFTQLISIKEQHGEQFQYIKAIGVIQPANESLLVQIEQHLLPLNLPYLFIEQPVFRSTLLSLCQLGIKQLAIEPPKIKQDFEQYSLLNKKILLVEDNLVNQMVANELLLSMGVKVEFAVNGQEAVDKVQAQSFDLVLMDIQMPVMDGLTATKKIRAMAQFENLPIIAMTAHAREEDRQNSFQAGMNLHIAKPVTKNKLKQGIVQVFKTLEEN